MAELFWTDEEVRRALGMRTDLAHEDLQFTGVSTDSRTIQAGALYVALVGDRFDGHDFIADAVASGAHGAVVSRPVAGGRGVALYAVDDTLVALGDLARHRRSRLRAPVVGLTGSSGKTTTKDFLAAALGGVRRTHATRGNRNNRVGVPLTILETPHDAEVVVLEMGTNEPGEIAILTDIARPDIAMLVTVGESHLEGLGSVEGVMEEKLDILRGLGAGARSVVGDEPPELPERARRIRPEVRVAGWSDRADEDARPGEVEVDTFGRYRFRWHGAPVSVPVPGRHAVYNALLALAVTDMLDVPAEAAARGLATARPGELRGQVRRVGDLTVIVDCYNANPQSVRAALDVLQTHQAPRRVAVLGTMLELGDASDRLHAEVLGAALEGDIDLVVATGAYAAAAEGDARASSDRVITAAGWREAYPELAARLEGDEVVLLKASRGIAMEGMLPLLEEGFGGGTGDDEAVD